MLKIKCEKCDDRLISLYYRKWDKKNKKVGNYEKIDELYCRNCKTPTKVIVMNWFKE